MISNSNRRFFGWFPLPAWRAVLGATFGAVLGGTLPWEAVVWANPVIDVSVAGFYIGQEVTVEDQVVAARRDGNLVRLQLGKPPHTLQVTLVEGILKRFPVDADRFYPGKTIRVSGVVREFRNSWEMIVRDPANLLVVEPRQPSDMGHSAGHPADLHGSAEQGDPVQQSQPPVGTGATGTRGGTSPSSGVGEATHHLQLRDLEERLRKLEIRVRRIEQGR